MQLNKVMVARGQTADRLSQDQALPAIRACVETSEAEGPPAPADTYLAAYVATEGSSEERKQRSRRWTTTYRPHLRSWGREQELRALPTRILRR